MVPAATIAAAVCLFLCLPRLLLIYILFCLFIYQQFTVNFIYGEMYFQSLVSHKHLDEFIYVPLFIAVITVNKVSRAPLIRKTNKVRSCAGVRAFP